MSGLTREQIKRIIASHQGDDEFGINQLMRELATMALRSLAPLSATGTTDETLAALKELHAVFSSLKAAENYQALVMRCRRAISNAETTDGK